MMSEPITSYVEVMVEWGGVDIGRPKPGEMQVYCENGVPKMVDFLCPCSCGHTCPTHLLEPGEKHDDNPWTRECWSFERGPNGVTLTPSIRWLNGCMAHFNITDGKVIMHPDSGK
jgi:hypothetical protein